jgi:hypothetical protein
MFQRRIMEVDLSRLELRERLATSLLQGPGPADAGLVAQLRASSPAGRPLYAVARTPEQEARLAGAPGLRRVYAGEGRNVYQFDD